MARIIVATSDGREVYSRELDPGWGTGATAGRELIGSHTPLLGAIGRAIEDAHILDAGGDPERPSEKAMRLAEERRSS